MLFINLKKFLRGIRDSSGWCLEISKDNMITQISGNQFIFDAISQMEEIPTISLKDKSPFVFFFGETKRKNRYTIKKKEDPLKKKNYGILNC